MHIKFVVCIKISFNCNEPNRPVYLFDSRVKFLVSFFFCDNSFNRVLTVTGEHVDRSYTGLIKPLCGLL